MKKIYSLILFCAIGFGVQAQVAEEAALPMPEEGKEKKMVEKKAQGIAQDEQGLTEAEVKAKRTQQRNADNRRKQIMENTQLTDKEREKALAELNDEQATPQQKKSNTSPVLKPLEPANLKKD